MFRFPDWIAKVVSPPSAHDLISGVGIDLGSAQTKVVVQDQVVFHQPSCVALQKKTGEVVAIGQAAADLLGKTPPHIEVIFPIRRGKVHNILATQLFLKFCLQTVLHQKVSSNAAFQRMFRPAIRLAIPLGTSRAEQDMLKKLFREIGYPRVSVVTQLQAAFQHLQKQKKVSHVFALVNIGAMTTEMAFFAGDEMVVRRSLMMGGNDFTSAVIHELQKQYHCQVGWQTAEKIKMNLGVDPGLIADFVPTQKSKKMLVRGRDILSSLPSTIQVTSDELAEIYLPFIHDLVQNTADLFQDAAPDVMSEGLDQGVMLTGGGSLLTGLAAVLESRLRSPIHTSHMALENVVRGI